ncbi:hypothetical protein DICPUDRAFT_87084 [Dictyostelium purpureum]|uniref:Actin n=1 Tax=Dictyostelium purpureum TaxID=5786 RepID=F0ZFU6_DICPU|nr:uncharacterized protein DICPUDRAFT_87084 [Dictyostelium purpureum]EGC37174.1 hypothetical protein DICPUDRAFT_87084 [Dictyostelium purpureum]|eukprot:XP_003286302.1 hypothetical protein DICPUDRAFT_87084 [Dictyostelium purpureum]
MVDPIKGGKVINWDAMERVWGYTFNELHVNSSQCNVHLTEMPFSPNIDREKKAEIMFEKFDVQNMYISLDAALSLFSIGKNTGLVVDSGYEVTNITPIFQGYGIKHTMQTLNIGGNTISKYLESLLMDNGASGSINSDTVNSIKEKLAYVSYDFNTHMANSTPSSFTLLDDTNVVLDKELFNAPEVLFQPEFFDMETDPLHKKIFKAINSSDIDIRYDLYNSIHLFGGNSLIPGLPERIKKELSVLTSSVTNIKVNTLPHDQAKFSSWIGGSKYCQILTDQKLWIPKEDYDEHGPYIAKIRLNH